MKRPVITLLTDFGTSDHYVGAMKGVLLTICPEAVIADITHEVTPYRVAEGAFKLAQSWACFPPGTVHVAVVDPGVGGRRRCIAVEAAGHYFVGPDNGIFSMVLDQTGPARAYALTEAGFFRNPVSRTFHGRDVFAPVAAHLASGVPAAAFGPPVPELVRPSSWAPVRTGPGNWTGMVLAVDRFGNIVTNLDSAEFAWLAGAPFLAEAGALRVTCFADTYEAAPPDRPFLVPGSSGYLEISLRQASAAGLAGCAAGIPLILHAG